MHPYNRFVLKLAALAVLGLAIYSCRGNQLQSHTHSTTRNFNERWQFARTIDTTVTAAYFKRGGEADWESVALPHTAHIEPLVIKDQQWQGTVFYRKFFKVPSADKGKHIAVKFGAAMHEADVYLNGQKLATHKGGYLPFVVNLTDKLNFGKENVLVVKLNNEDNPTIPPGKPIKSLDFNYFSGLYRNVRLLVDDKLHISDPIAAGRTAAGGLRVHYSKVSNKSATVNLQTDVSNLYSQGRSAYLTTSLRDEDHNVVARLQSEPKEISADTNALFRQAFTIENPRLWSPDQPYLYTITATLHDEDGNTLDSKQERIGIRTISFDEENGFLLNGKRLQLRGTNRHQSYPYIGYALSNNAQYRDAYKIKEAGFNFIRTAHYPPSPAFLDACDELGILFMDAIPGWQFFGGEEFQQLSYRNIRRMIRRDRNHPSVVLWEASLNESNMDKSFMEKANVIVHEELPFEDAYSTGWMDYAYDIFIPARQHSQPPEYWNDYSKDKPLFIAEYGDWEYYAQNAGFNQEAFEDLQEQERNSRQLRGDGQKRLAQQALNFQEAHNSNLQGPAFGDANWVMYDYNRGYAPNLEASGIRDIFRIPKFAFYFYRSQAGPNMDNETEFGKPMVYIANFWSDSTFTKAKVYSNTEEVALYLNGELVDRKRPDNGRLSSHLRHPPFTYELNKFEPGSLRAVGFINGQKVAETVRHSPGQPSSLQLEIDSSGRPLQAGQKDVVFVYASVIDANGTTVPTDSSSVTFSVEGDVSLIGRNSIKAEAGIAAILLRAGKKGGEGTIRAETHGLKSAEKNINIQN